VVAAFTVFLSGRPHLQRPVFSSQTDYQSPPRKIAANRWRRSVGLRSQIVGPKPSAASGKAESSSTKPWGAFTRNCAVNFPPAGFEQNHQKRVGILEGRANALATLEYWLINPFYCAALWFVVEGVPAGVGSDGDGASVTKKVSPRGMIWQRSRGSL